MGAHRVEVESRPDDGNNNYGDEIYSSDQQQAYSLDNPDDPLSMAYVGDADYGHKRVHYDYYHRVDEE